MRRLVIDGERGCCSLAEDARHRQRFERGADNMRSSRTVRVVGGFGFEEFRVGQDDTQLVVQLVKQRAEITVLRVARTFSGHVRRRDGGQSRMGGTRAETVYAAVVGEEIRNPSGCRQSESVKIRMLPPAVLTYSTFPAAIQL
jgi:hypothetical protein